MFRKSIRGNKFLVLDIGTEAVKALVFKQEARKKEGNFLFKKGNFKNVILGHSVQYFERYKILGSSNFERDILKRTILKALDGVWRNFIFFSKKENSGKSNQVNWDLTKLPVVISLPANVVKARVLSTVFTRGKSAQLKISRLEEENIYQQVFQKARKKIFSEFSQKYGILPAEIKLIGLKNIQTKIDGYSVPCLKGYKGKNAEIKFLTIFWLKNYFEKISKVCRDLKLNIQRIVHLAEVLPFVLKDDKRDGFFIDVGGEISQFFLVKSGFLEKSGEFSAGGKIFSQYLSDDLGVDEETARMLKEEYSQGLLSSGSAKKIREILEPAKKNWYSLLKNKVKENGLEDFFSSNIFLFGGGSLLPEIGEVLREKGIVDLNDSRFFQSFKINFLNPDDLDNIEDATNSLKSPKDVPLLLNTFAIKN